MEEYVEFRGLPVSPDRMRSGVLVTEWFPAGCLELPPTPLAECPGRPVATEEDPNYRARYRFSILARGGFRLFHVEAHWQREGGEGADASKPWVDCRSTGAWEREAEDSIILRARLLSQRYRGPT